MFKMALKESIPILQMKKWVEAYGSLVNRVQLFSPKLLKGYCFDLGCNWYF